MPTPTQWFHCVFHFLPPSARTPHNNLMFTEHHQFILADALKLFFHTWPKYMSVAMNDSGLTCEKALSSQTNCTTKPLFLEIIGTSLIKPPTTMNYSCCSSFVVVVHWKYNFALLTFFHHLLVTAHAVHFSMTSWCSASKKKKTNSRAGTNNDPNTIVQKLNFSSPL